MLTLPPASHCSLHVNVHPDRREPTLPRLVTELVMPHTRLLKERAQNTLVKFSSQHSYGGSQLSVIPVPGDLTPAHKYTCSQNTYVHKINYLKKEKQNPRYTLSLTLCPRISKSQPGREHFASRLIRTSTFIRSLGQCSEAQGTKTEKGILRTQPKGQPACPPGWYGHDSQPALQDGVAMTASLHSRMVWP